ncbi:MAG: hypothetical protein [Bacteriophage sp.]|nr:MAG: hypothetical protein [Bacteriophage sp.]
MEHKKTLHLYLHANSLGFGSKPADCLFASCYKFDAESAAKSDLIDLNQTVDISFEYDKGKSNEDLVKVLRNKMKSLQAAHYESMKNIEDQIANLRSIEDKSKSEFDSEQ